MTCFLALRGGSFGAKAVRTLLASSVLLVSVRSEPLPFDVSYPQAGTPGERVHIELVGEQSGQADILHWGGQDIALSGKKAVDLEIPGNAVPGSNLILSLKTKNGSEHELPALAIVWESSSFGRGRLITRYPPLAASCLRRVVLPLRVSSPYCVNGFSEIDAGPFFSGPWPAGGMFFLRTVEGTVKYSDPLWYTPIAGREETFADYTFEEKEPLLVDRWKRDLSRAAAGAVANEGGLPVLVFPSPQPVKLTVADLPSGPVTISFWLYPNNALKPQIIRSSSILSVGIDAAGKYYAARWDEDQEKRSVTSSEKVEPDRWQHVAAVFDGTTLRLYQDGRFVGAEPCRGRRSSPKNICESLGSGDDGKTPFIGMVGAYTVYNHALPPETIHDIAAAFLQSVPVATTQ